MGPVSLPARGHSPALFPSATYAEANPASASVDPLPTEPTCTAMTQLIIDAPVSRTIGRFVPVPLPPAGTFDGQTVLVVGGTAGLGLASAVHFANLGANVIITSRAESRAQAAKRHVEEASGPSRRGVISCLELDLERYDSCTGFMAKLRGSLSGPDKLDVAVINGGIVNSHWEESPHGW